MNRKCLLAFVILSCTLALAQPDQRYAVHSHNDYKQNVPFWKAVSAGVSSLEADIFLVGDSLFVAHTATEIKRDRDIETLYLKPLQQALDLNLLSSEPLQFLVDIKSDAYSTLGVLIETLKRYPSLISNEKVSIVISGNRPKPEEYINYPNYIFFDYQSLESVPTQEIRDKIALISLDFGNYSDWNGKGRLTANDHDVVTETIKKAHNLKKPFRFWGTPDSKTAWKAFAKLNIDYINTDLPFECVGYLNTLSQREYRNTMISEVYRPNFNTDGKPLTVENIILLLGDGNGLTQISATALANSGALSVTQLKNIGFLKTQSVDDFTTDSAGGATAMATGKKAANRAIGVAVDGTKLENITEFLAKKKYRSGIVTTDEITGATPAAFYAHQKDRSMSEAIRADLLRSHLSVFVAKNADGTAFENTVSGFTMLSSVEELQASGNDRVGYFFKKDSALKATPIDLSGALSSTLHFLSKKTQPFFLMVEGAKIDSNGHANDIGGIIREGIAFDRAVGTALRFADENPTTLVIVTADHETGGLTLPQGNVATHEIEGDFTTDDHTGVLVPIFAYGPKSDEFRGVYENHELFSKMLKVLGVSIEE